MPYESPYNFIKYTIKKGEHYCTPKIYKVFIGPTYNISWRLNLTKSLIYNIGNEDQYDWSKLTGISLFKVIPNDNNSIRLGYRYIKGNEFELTPYYHIDGNIKTGEIYKIKFNTIIDLHLTLAEGRAILFGGPQEQPQFLFKEYIDIGKFPFAYENNFYFGGNQPAPTNLTLYKERL